MIEKIAYYLGQNSDEPNIRLAEELVKKNDVNGIAEIAQGLDNEKEQIVNDCIKVLYEIGYRNPTLIVNYAELFIKKLQSRNNRVVWGSCIALAQIAELEGDYLYREFDIIYKAYKNGSVITVDNCISIFAGIAKSNKKYEKKVFPIIIEHLEHCRAKEVGQHAERAFICVNAKNADEFKAALMKRYGSLVESQKKRVDKLIKRIEKEDY